MRDYNGKTLDQINVGDRIKITGYSGYDDYSHNTVGKTFTVTEVEPDYNYEGGLFVVLDWESDGWFDDDYFEYEWVEAFKPTSLPTKLLTNWSLKITESYELTRLVLEALGYKSYHLVEDTEEEDKSCFNAYNYIIWHHDDDDEEYLGNQYCYSVDANLNYADLNEFVLAHTNESEIKQIEAEIEELQTKLKKLKGEN